MDSERDVTRIVRSWLRTDEHENADRVLDDVLALLDTNTQRRGWRPAWGITDVCSSAKLAIAVAAVVIVAVVGINLMPTFGVVGGPTATPSISPAPTPAATAFRIRPPAMIEPGSFVLSTPRARVHLTMPAGWSGDESGINLLPGVGYSGMLDLAVTANDVSYVVTDVCADEAHVAFAPVGPTVEDLTTALTNQTGIQGSGPTNVILGGYPAKKLVLTLLPACPMRNGIWADASRTYGFGLRHGETATVYVVDVNGDRLVIWSAYMNGASAEHIAQLEAITASIDIEPVLTGGPLPGVAVEGPLPIGRHSIWVDGVALSYSVPAFEADKPYGWVRYRSISLTKDTLVDGQAADAAILWTGFPDGAETDPCANLLNPPVGPSIADLAAAMATAPGTGVVSGPSDVILDGRAAQHLVLTVRDPGCNPGFFFTWDPAPGGPGWWTTSAGDTIRVWIVDADGKRLVIAGLTVPGAGSKVEQEIQGIVDSIHFE